MSIRDYIPPKKEKKIKIQPRVEADLYRAFIKQVEKEGANIQTIIEAAMREFLAEKKDRK